MQFIKPQIRNHQYMRQVIDFSGLRYGNMTPTDVDGELDICNKGWLLFEWKKEGAELPDGQKLALERHCDDFAQIKPTMLLVADFDDSCLDAYGAVNALLTTVREYRWLGKWEKISENFKVWADLFFYAVMKGIF